MCVLHDGGLLYKKATPASGEYSLFFGINSMCIALIAGTLGFLVGLTSKTKSIQKQVQMVDLFKQPE